MGEAGEMRGPDDALEDTRFGAIAAWAGFVPHEAVDEALAEQSAARASGGSAPRIGEVLTRKGLLTEEQARRVLKVQLQRLPSEGHLVFGRIAEAHRFISPQEHRRALDVQARELVAGGEVRPVSEILVDTGAMDRAAAEAVTSYQAKADPTHMAKASRARVGADGGSSPARGEPEAPPGGRARPVFLPRGALGFAADHSTWLVIAAAVVMAAVLIVFKERIFGASGTGGAGARTGRVEPAE